MTYTRTNSSVYSTESKCLQELQTGGCKRKEVIIVMNGGRVAISLSPQTTGWLRRSQDKAVFCRLAGYTFSNVTAVVSSDVILWCKPHSRCQSVTRQLLKRGLKSEWLRDADVILWCKPHCRCLSVTRQLFKQGLKSEWLRDAEASESCRFQVCPWQLPR